MGKKALVVGALRSNGVQSVDAVPVRRYSVMTDPARLCQSVRRPPGVRRAYLIEDRCAGVRPP